MLVEPGSPVFENDCLEKPGEKDRKPDIGDWPPQSQSHADRVEGKTDKASLDIGQNGHQNHPGPAKGQMPGVDRLGVVDIAGDPVASVVDQAAKAPAP